MAFTNRLQYYRRIFSAYLGPGKSQLTFWHETPTANPRLILNRLGEYYMLFAEKADYSGIHDEAGIPMLDYRGKIGAQYNPIAIAQWGLANFNRYVSTPDANAEKNSLRLPTGFATTLKEILQTFRCGNITSIGTIGTP